MSKKLRVTALIMSSIRDSPTYVSSVHYFDRHQNFSEDYRPTDVYIIVTVCDILSFLRNSSFSLLLVCVSCYFSFERKRDIRRQRIPNL